MKKIKNIILIIVLLISISACTKDKYVGYWCRYDEGTIIKILIKDNATAKQKAAIEDKIETFENMTSSEFISKEEYISDLKLDEDADIYGTYIVRFDSIDNIGTYITEINKLAGVQNAEQVTAKNNMSLYNLKKDGTYTFAQTEDASSSEMETGTYKIKDSVIVFTPDNGSDQSYVYIKDEHLCLDTDCTKIFAATDSSCQER